MALTSYEEYCFADPIFYDTPARWGTSSTAFAAAREPAPEGWERLEKGVWLALHPRGIALPPQGWKVHVSTCLDEAVEVLDTVRAYCVERGVAFKFLPSRTGLVARNAKYAARESSGKFITVYPATEAELEQVVADLSARLAGRHGPYVLSDLRIGDGPLYVRYGGFAERHCWSERGERVLAIERPDGTLVPDPRRPTFEVPDWVEVPAFLQTHLERRRSDGSPADFPFQVEKVLHFSNAGGIYLATDTRDGRRVVLKEARPHAGLDYDGVDAVTRMRREAEVMRRLAGLDVVPELYDYLTCWEHHFLVQEYVEGETLHHEQVVRYPLIYPEYAPTTLSQFTDWALDVIGQVDRGVRAIHRRGVVFGDLHPKNILVRPDGQVRLIDFELASYLGEDRKPALGAPGFVAPRDRTGVDIDLYALGCVKLAMFCPVTVLMNRDRDKPQALVRAVIERFPLPAGYGEQVLRDLGVPTGGAAPRPLIEPAGTGDARAWQQVRNSIAAGIVASATPHRTDRLFPGDIGQFSYGALGMAGGAAGVLYALAESDAGRHPRFEEWLIRRAREDANPSLGFYDGLYGVAFALDRLGRHAAAMDVLDRAMGLPMDDRAVDLFAGLAGAGLTMLHLAGSAGRPDLRSVAVETAERVAATLARGQRPGAADGEGTGRNTRVGLMHGASGPALLFVRVYEATGDPRWLDRAAEALRGELAECVESNDMLQVRAGTRVIPYLNFGSTGIGMVLMEYLAHRDDPAFAEALAGISRAAYAEMVVNPGLFNGRAGMVAYLSRLHALTGAPDLLPLITRHLGWLDRYATRYEGHLAFPGDHLLRLSMDLATGSAGILLVLSAHRDGRCALPFFDSTPMRRGTEPPPTWTRPGPHHPVVHAGGR